MIKEILGDLLPDLGDIEPIDPGCGCNCESGKEALKNTGAAAAVGFK
jgi:hypothetical protein